MKLRSFYVDMDVSGQIERPADVTETEAAEALRPARAAAASAGLLTDPMAVFNVAVKVVLVAAILVTTWFAWQAGRESWKATEWALETARLSQAAATAAQ